MTPHDAALNYARNGWRVIPILPNTKRPSLTRWTEQATTNPETINHWWTDNPTHGVGIATGPTSGIFVVDIDDLDALHDLQQQHGNLPDTLTNLTGSGGMHLIYRHPAGIEIRNDAGRRLAPGIDIRGDGGQIVAPPTIHPNGTPYSWDAGQPSEPVDAPDWLIQLVAGPTITEPARRERSTLAQSDRPGDLFAAATTWNQLLEPDGWTLHHIDRDGEHHWTRPGKNVRDGTSATTGYQGSDTLKIFTSNVANLGLTESGTYTKLGYLAATRFHGDHHQAASFLAQQGWTTPTPDFAELIETSIQTGQPPEPVAELINDTVEALHAVDTPEPIGWTFTDLTDIIAGTDEPIVTTMLTCTDGTTSLMYPTKVHTLAGEPGGGKTWVALVAIAETVNRGGTAILIDYEDNPRTAISRLRKLGVTNSQLQRFRYINPPSPIQDRNGRMSPATIETLAWIENQQPDLVVIDSVGESISNEGSDQNDDNQVTTWSQLIPKRLARWGSTVLMLDHVTKNKETRGQFAIGSQRKLAAVTGAAYILDVRTAPSRTADGHLRVTCAKDRHGTFQARHTVCDIHIVNRPDGKVAVTLEAPDGQEFRPTRYMQDVSLHLEMYGDSTKKDVEAEVDGKATYIRQAVSELIADGYVTVRQEGRSHVLHLVEPYRQPGVTLSDLSQPQAGEHHSFNGTESDETGETTAESGDEITPISSRPNSPENHYSSHSSPPRPPANTSIRPAPGDEPKSSRPHFPPPIGGERDEKTASPNTWLH